MGAAGATGGAAARAGVPGARGAGHARAPAPAPAIRLVALDLDGVVWRGDRVFPGARAALEDVLRRGLDLRYVSNNSTAHRETVSERLAGAGLPAGSERVLTSGFVAGRWLRERLPEGAPVMVVGEEGLLRELREAGLDAYHAACGADGAVASAAPAMPSSGAVAPAAVVVGMDRCFTYKALAAAQAAIRAGALYVATNSDATFPTPEGLVPGAGSIVAAVSAAAQQEPVLLGKPGLALAETLVAVTGVPAAQTLFVGDRLSTDIAMGHQAGMVTALVLTGVTSEDDLRRAEAEAEAALPDHVLPGLRELPRLLGSFGA
jgi:phosphoglycolate/pyridoxal phosphate phosphatase family enzyme